MNLLICRLKKKAELVFKIDTSSDIDFERERKSPQICISYAMRTLTMECYQSSSSSCRWKTPVPKKVSLGFETLVQVLNTDSGQDSRFHYPFEKSFLELQHACLNLKWAVCVVFLLHRNSQLLSQILDIFPSINRSGVKLHNVSLFCHLIRCVKF